MIIRRALPALYLALNVACALLALSAAQQVGVLAAAEQRGAADAVDGIAFFVAAAPGLLVAGTANGAWALLALWAAAARRAYGPAAWLGAAAAVWAATVLAARTA